jgi:hypothetical protein
MFVLSVNEVMGWPLVDRIEWGTGHLLGKASSLKDDRLFNT